MVPSRLSVTLRDTSLALALAFGASGAALADDNSMSSLTGDSYAYFNGLVYTPGGFNVASTARPAADTAAARGAASPSAPAAVVQPAHVEPLIEHATMLAARPAIAPSKVFDDGTGA
ncbi:MAG TPA: hypothetical protein VF925_08910 [Casimicrobiaceae bacterium]